MGRADSVIVVALLVLATSLPCRAASTWTRLQTEHFLFIGDASERQIRQVAQHLEQFREVMSRVLPPAAVSSSLPITVFVFQSNRSFAPYRPRFEGRPIELAGYFHSGRDVNYVAINAEFEQTALRIIFHEYAHFLVSNTTGNLPPWANEGLAGVYETFEEHSGGGGATIGMPNGEHVRLLQKSTLMPLRDLLAVDYSSAVYNEGSRRGLFYAESWAVMHYLMLGNQARTAQLRDYLNRTKNGASDQEAFTLAFGGNVDALEREVRDYIRSFSFPALRIDFTEKVKGSGAGRGEPIEVADASAYLGDLLSQLGRIEEARAQLQALVSANPLSARAASALGLLELKAGRVDQALPLLERAAGLDPTDGTVQRAWGRALFASSQTQRDADATSTETLQRSRAVLNRAVELMPRDAETLSLLGRLEATVGADQVRATTLFERAVASAPGEDSYRMQLAESLARQQEYARAITYLGPLVGGGKSPEVRAAARGLLATAADLLRETSGDRSAAGAHDANPASSLADPASLSSRPGLSKPPPPSATGGRFVPQLRAVGDGERRVLGLFTAVECRPGAIALIIESDGKRLRLAAADLSRVDFISYRQTPPGAINCGPIGPTSRVFATFREDDTPAGGGRVDGRVIAIELLPDDFPPR